MSADPTEPVGSPDLSSPSPPVGEGWGEGLAEATRARPHSPTPTADPFAQGGGGPKIARATGPWRRRVMQALLYGSGIDRARKTRARLGLAILGFALVYAIIALRLVLYAALPDTRAVHRGGTDELPTGSTAINGAPAAAGTR